jgi:hypothetical protein
MLKEIPEELSAAVYSLHGTETSPKEMVADPIARGAIGGNLWKQGPEVNIDVDIDNR